MVRIIRMTPIILLVLLDSCINPINIDIDKGLDILIVDGSITTRPGPHKIRLSRSSRYGNILSGAIIRVNGASVVIRDSEGNNFPLEEEIFTFVNPLHGHSFSSLSGVYATEADFSAEVGKSYTLLITTAGGVEFTSLPEKVVPTTDILQLNTEFIKIATGGIEFRAGINLYATIQDSPEDQNFYMWRNSGTYRAITFPEDYTIPSGVGGPDIPHPLECCKVCWITELMGDNSLRVFSDLNVNGNRIIDHAAFIYDDGLRFGDKYLARIELHSLNRGAFKYYNLLNGQLSITGNIFDPPPATIRGNMINLSTPDENVIGYFRASDVSIDSVFILKNMLQAPSPYLPINNDCRKYKGGTPNEPSYW